MNICKVCQSEITTDDRFCPECGSPLETGIPPTPTPPIYPTPPTFTYVPLMNAKPHIPANSRVIKTGFTFALISLILFIIRPFIQALLYQSNPLNAYRFDDIMSFVFYFVPLSMHILLVILIWFARKSPVLLILPLGFLLLDELVWLIYEISNRSSFSASPTWAVWVVCLIFIFLIYLLTSIGVFKNTIALLVTNIILLILTLSINLYWFIQNTIQYPKYFDFRDLINNVLIVNLPLFFFFLAYLIVGRGIRFSQSTPPPQELRQNH